MSEVTAQRRGTRRNLSTQPIPRGTIGAHTLGQSIRYTPIPNITALLAIARAQRAREDAAAERKAS